MEGNVMEVKYDKGFNRCKCIVIFLSILFIQNFVINATSFQKLTYVYLFFQSLIDDPTFFVNELFGQMIKTCLVYLVPFAFDGIIITLVSIIYIILLVRLFISKPASKIEVDKVLSLILLLHFVCSLIQGLSYIVVGFIIWIFPSIGNDILFLYPVAFDFITGGVILAWCVLMIIIYVIFKSVKKKRK